MKERKQMQKDYRAKYCHMPNPDHLNGLCDRFVVQGHSICALCERELVIESIDIEMFNSFARRVLKNDMS